ncbi:hypothetical protein CGCTS75_v007632 [Colletotrichum tropicale]|nr:hypothetical protein CGCTS75_v007632 [Colletotrichum tropicale]
MESHLCTVSKDTDGFGRLHVHVSVGGNTSRCMSSLPTPTLPTTTTNLLVASFLKRAHTHTLTHTSYPFQACAAVEVAAWGRGGMIVTLPLSPLSEAKYVCVLSWHVSYRNAGRGRCWLWESDGEGKGID